MNNTVVLRRVLIGWSIHLLTASTAVLGLYTLVAITSGQYLLAFWLMAAAMAIDSLDGTLARQANVAKVIPYVDGGLLDNIVDYINYVLTPAYFLLFHPTILPEFGRGVFVSLILLSSAYQFSQTEAKTDDNFFKGFPCYWNIVAFYMFLLAWPSWLNACVIVIFTILVFVPIKYIYLSRMDHLTKSTMLKRIMLFMALVFGATLILSLFLYPQKEWWLINLSLAYGALYFLVSVYRTLVSL